MKQRPEVGKVGGMSNNHPAECLHTDKWDAIEQTLGRIEAAVKATNGRVRALEAWRVGFVASLATIGGMVVAISAVIGPKLTAILAGLAAVQATSH